MHKVMIFNTKKISVKEAVAEIFKEFAPDLRGKKVLVKPSMLAPTSPDAGVTTHPEVVEAVVRELLAREADVSVADNPGGLEGNSAGTAKKTGIYDASLGHFVNYSERLVEVPANCEYTKTFLIPKLILETDYIVSLPMFKTHLLTVLTGAIKNVYGYIPGAMKSQLHQKAPTRRKFSELLVDLHAIRPPNLHIMDALTYMQGNGPQHGEVKSLGLILGSDNAVAMDAVEARMAGIDPSSLHYLNKAKEKGLGSFDTDEIEIIGEFTKIPDFKPPTTWKLSSQEQAKIIEQVRSLRPVLNEEICIKCGDCATSCPPQAIQMYEFPNVDKDKCIQCWCCCELCPEGAMTVPSEQPKLGSQLLY